MDLSKRNEAFLTALYGDIKDRLLEDDKNPVMSKEVMAFYGVSEFLKEGEMILRDSRQERNRIMALPISGDEKRQQIDALIELENIQLKLIIDSLAQMDVDFLFQQTFTDNVKELGVIPGFLSTVIFGERDDTFRPNPREQ